MARLLSIDYGAKRCGIAITDELQIIASGLTTVGTKKLINFLINYLEKENVELFIVGLPKQLNNQPSESERLIQGFLIKLTNIFPHIPIKRVDERFTSKLALQAMVDGGLKKMKRQNKAIVDEVSATIILQSYMQSRDTF